MEQYQSINHVLENMDNNIIYQKKNSIWNGLTLIFLGLIVLVLNFSLHFNSASFVPHLLLVVGVSIIVVGLFSVLFRKNHFYSTNHGKLFSREICFDNQQKDKLIRLLVQGDIEGVYSLKKSSNNHLILKIMITKDAQICFSQVMQFVNFSYENINETKQHPAHEALFLKSL